MTEIATKLQEGLCHLSQEIQQGLDAFKKGFWMGRDKNAVQENSGKTKRRTG
jgi:hypothetical protein